MKNGLQVLANPGATKRESVAIRGVGPIHGDVYLGLDGTLWKWTGNGQQVVAISGDAAVEYATKHGFSERAIDVVRASAARA